MLLFKVVQLLLYKDLERRFAVLFVVQVCLSSLHSFAGGQEATHWVLANEDPDALVCERTSKIQEEFIVHIFFQSTRLQQYAFLIQPYA